jgi:hypothetical protein
VTPFTNAYHGPDHREPASLAARIDGELRARIEDAVDYACLDAMVHARRACDAPFPGADNPGDRAEFMARVETFLERLRLAIVTDLSDEQRRRLGAGIGALGAEVSAAIDLQVRLAKELPDYWQRFEAVRLGDPDMARLGRASGGPSGGERRRLLDRLLGRG